MLLFLVTCYNIKIKIEFNNSECLMTIRSFLFRNESDHWKVHLGNGWTGRSTSCLLHPCPVNPLCHLFAFQSIKREWRTNKYWRVWREPVWIFNYDWILVWSFHFSMYNSLILSYLLYNLFSLPQHFIFIRTWFTQEHVLYLHVHVIY